jgi:hypothetical protein
MEEGAKSSDIAKQEKFGKVEL